LLADEKEESIQKERKLIAGTWKVVSLEVSGNKVADEDARKLSIVNGADGTWTLRSEDKEVAKGVSEYDPTKKPKTIDFVITEGGGKDQKFLGIYELGEKTRKLCFAPTGQDRPTEFQSLASNEWILLTLERQ
jgi:uncharacterized protein (TIGR03067 family)